MTLEDEIGDKKLHYDINRETPKISDKTSMNVLLVKILPFN